MQGVEQSASSVQVACEIGANAIQADLGSNEARNLIPDDDNAVFNYAFEYVQNQLVFLGQLKEGMRPDRLILLVPNPDSLWRYLFGGHWNGWDPPFHVHYYTAIALCGLLEKTGLRVVAIRSICSNDSLADALNHIGIRVGHLRYVLSFDDASHGLGGFGPELLCVAELRDESGCGQ